MRKTFPLLFLLIVPFLAFGMDHFAMVQTMDGKQYQGEISNKGNLIEWRKDIYEARNEKGYLEKFKLMPENKGKLGLDEIIEIRRIKFAPGLYPEQYATLSDGTKAKLVLQYLILLRDGKSFFISDFVTLEYYYLDISSSDYTKRIYLSQIKSLKYLDKPLVQKKEEGSGEKVRQKERSMEPEKVKLVPENLPEEMEKGLTLPRKKYDLLPWVLVLFLSILLVFFSLLFIFKRRTRSRKGTRSRKRAHRSRKTRRRRS